MQDQHRSASHAYRRFLIVCISLLMIIGGMVVWFWNGPGSALVASAPPFTIERQADGSWPAVPSDAPGFAWSLDLSKRESKTNFSSSQSTSNAQGARLASRSVAVFNTSSEPLADLISRGVIEGLQTDRKLQRITYTPKNGEQPSGELAPDIVITIAVGDHNEDTVMGTGSSNSNITVTMSDQLTRGISSTVSPNQAPHRVTFSMRLTSNTNVEQEGIATPNARLQSTANNLSHGILERIRSSLDTMRDDHGTFPELPATFYPEYVPIDASRFDINSVFAKGESFRQLASWRARLIHNQTWWQGQVAGSMQESMARVGERLVAAGFKATDDSQHDYTYRLDTLEVELIPGRKRVGVIVQIPGKPAPVARTTNLHVRYTHYADPGVRSAALESVLNDDSSPELLMMCAPAWDEKLRKRGQSMVDSLDLQDARQLLQRARLRHLGNDDEGAANDLALAVTFAQTGFRGGPKLQDAKKLAKKWEIEFESKLRNPEWLRNHGLVELVRDADPIERDVTPDAPLRAFHQNDGAVAFIAVGLKGNAKTHWNGAYRVVDGGTEYSGTLAGSSLTPIHGGWVTAELLDDASDGQSRARVHLR